MSRDRVVCMEWPGIVAVASRVACSICGRVCAISPETRKAIDGQDVDVVCLDCLAPPPDAVLMPPTEGQIREMLE